MGRKNIKVPEPLFNALRDDKDDTQSWPHYLETECLGAGGGDDGHPNSADVDAIADAVAERIRSPNADDIQTAVESGVENALPERLGR